MSITRTEYRHFKERQECIRGGLLTVGVGAFGQRGLYNSQEIGMARKLDLLVDEGII